MTLNHGVSLGEPGDVSVAHTRQLKLISNGSNCTGALETTAEVLSPAAEGRGGCFDKFGADFHGIPRSCSIFLGVVGQEMETVKGQAGMEVLFKPCSVGICLQYKSFSPLIWAFCVIPEEGKGRE